MSAKTTASQSSTAKQKAAQNYVGLQRNPVRTYPTFVPKDRIGATGKGEPPFEPQNQIAKVSNS